MVPETIAKCGAVMQENLVPGLEYWYKFYQFFYDGECYEYAFNAGSNLQTPQQAIDTAERHGLARKAQTRFLEDVRLETMQ